MKDLTNIKVKFTRLRRSPLIPASDAQYLHLAPTGISRGRYPERFRKERPVCIPARSKVSLSFQYERKRQAAM